MNTTAMYAICADYSESEKDTAKQGKLGKMQAGREKKSRAKEMKAVDQKEKEKKDTGTRVQCNFGRVISKHHT